jgi:hypothetical protein
MSDNRYDNIGPRPTPDKREEVPEKWTWAAMVLETHLLSIARVEVLRNTWMSYKLKLTSSIPITDKRKSPNISEIDSKTNDSQKKLSFLVPSFSFVKLCYFRSSRTCRWSFMVESLVIGNMNSMRRGRRYHLEVTFATTSIWRNGWR